MNIEEILAACISALEEGATVEECLARYPLYADELAPLLQIVDGLQSGPELRVSDIAFVEARMALALAARSREQSHDAKASPVSTPSSPEVQPSPITARVPLARDGVTQATPLLDAFDNEREDAQAIEQGVVGAATPVPRLPAATRRQRPGWFSWPSVAGGALAACALLVSLLLVRSAANSLPGQTLYGVKRAAEQTQGALMIAAGERATWHARQAERRLREAIALHNRGMQASPELLEEADQQAQSALAASNSLVPVERSRFLSVWLESLVELESDSMAAGAPASTLRGTMLAVETALDGEPAFVVEVEPTWTVTAVMVALVTATPARPQTEATASEQAGPAAAIPSPAPSATQAVLVLFPTPTSPPQATPEQDEQPAAIRPVPTSRATVAPRRPAVATPQSAPQAEVGEAGVAPTATPILLRDPTPTWTPRLAATPTPVVSPEIPPDSSQGPVIAVLPSDTPAGETIGDGPVELPEIAEAPAMEDDIEEDVAAIGESVRAASTTVTVTLVMTQPGAGPLVTPTLTITPTATLTATATPSTTALPTVTPTPTATSTPEDAGTPPIMPTSTPSPAPSLTPSLTPLPTATPLAEATSQENETPLPTTIPVASDTPDTPTSTPPPTWTATTLPEPVATTTSTPSLEPPTATPVPTLTATVTATAVPTETPLPTATPTAEPTTAPSATPADETPPDETPQDSTDSSDAIDSVLGGD